MTRLHKRRALLIGNELHDDGRFTPLPSTRADVWALAQVLKHRNIGNFVSVRTESDLTADDMRQAIGEFLAERDEDELALLYVSGHGVRRARDGGEFHFVARDTDFDKVAETGVSAGFVNEALEQCCAPQKVVMIDCCRSGGFAVGLRTSDRAPDGSVAKSGERALLTSRGVYVLSSSRAGEDSYADTGGEEVRPSAFTAEVVEALRTGKVSKDGSSEISVEDLFHYVNRRMRAQGGRQVPVHSAHAVDDRIVIAASPLGRAPILEPLSHRPRPGPDEAPPPVTKSAGSRPAWSDLLDYYRQCVLAHDSKAPLMDVGHRNASYVCLTGAERFLSGDVDTDGCVAVPEGAIPLVESASAEEAELWAGYPAVVLTTPRSGHSWRHPKFAPLLIRRVEIVQGEGGEVRLKPYGPVQPHPKLAQEWLGEEEAAQLADTFQPTWHRGQHDRMAVDATNLLAQDFELPCVQELRPDQLTDHIDIHTPGHGARNTAVLFTTRPDTNFTKRLLDDFADIGKRTDRIQETALGALAPDDSERARALALSDPEPARLVTPLPCNEAQAEVIRSAMTRRLTVATGPPGTGKSQLVANLVATAVTAGQTVLVASTNNEAVDEVWRRCEELVPGSVVRTGSARKNGTNYAEREAASLHELRLANEPSVNMATAAMDAEVAADRLARVRRDLAHVSTTDRRLLRAAEGREEHAGRLGLSVPELHASLDGLTHPGEVEARAGRLARARFLGTWRRTRFLRRLGLGGYDGDPLDGCLALAGFAAAEADWRDLREQAATTDDTALTASLRDAESAVRTASHTLLASTVRANARAGRRRIFDLLRARDGDRSDWPQMRNVLRAHGRGESAAVGGWAVTSLSARRFPLGPALFDLVVVDESGQCPIPHVLPLLFRARRALVIGDPMQLTHITEISPEHEALIRRGTGLRSEWLEKHRLAYRRHSAFHAAERSVGGTLLLDEHFRCHPHIAALSNDLFYDGDLTVLTDTRGRPALPRPAVIWTHVSGRAARPRNGNSWVNEAEGDKVEASVRYLLEHLPAQATVGVVTPFTAQAEALRGRLRRYGEERLRVGTVHTFQGGERDVMVFSLVAGEGMRTGAVTWVSGQLNLWNVAITRARSHLIVVGDKDLWRKREGVAAALLEAAEREEGRPRGDAGDPLLKRLYRVLSGRPGVAVTLGENIRGHPVDALVRGADGATSTAVLLDRGPDEGADAARHLRLVLHHRGLLADEEAEDSAVRWPAWRLYEAGGG